MTPLEAPRDAILEALFGLLIATQRFQTFSRNFTMWDQVSLQPAMFFREYSETVERSAPLAPPRRILNVDVFVYARTDAKPNETKALVLNVLLDAIDTALAPVGADLINHRQTLGGLAYHAYVDGEILKEPGYLDGQAVAVIPVKIMRP